jgi:hypothetical protein
MTLPFQKNSKHENLICPARLAGEGRDEPGFVSL